MVAGGHSFLAQLWVDSRRGPHAVKLAAAADAAVLDVKATTDARLPVVRHDVSVPPTLAVVTNQSPRIVTATVLNCVCADGTPLRCTVVGGKHVRDAVIV